MVEEFQGYSLELFHHVYPQFIDGGVVFGCDRQFYRVFPVFIFDDVQAVVFVFQEGFKCRQTCLATPLSNRDICFLGLCLFSHRF